jgi:sugar (pentulose or hexulose) kinase
MLCVSEDMPVESYAAKGMFVDLEPMFSKDEEIAARDYLDNVINASRIDGKMYFISPAFNVIGLIGKGEKRENIAYAVVHSIVQKVASQAGRLKLDQTVCLTGGLCELPYLREQLGKALKCHVVSSPDGRYAGAAGAALSALKSS